LLTGSLKELAVNLAFFVSVEALLPAARPANGRQKIKGGIRKA
jgi:hypothetical protein